MGSCSWFSMVFLLLLFFVLLAVVVAAAVFVAVAAVSNATAEKCKESQTSIKGKAIKIKHIARKQRKPTSKEKRKTDMITMITPLKNKESQEPQTSLVAKINGPP